MHYHADLEWVRTAFRNFSRTVVIRADGTEIHRRAEPGILGGKKHFPGHVNIAVGSVADVGANALEGFTVDVDPSLARRMFRLACDIGGVIDAVEVDRLAEVVLPTAMGRRGKACHLGGRGPYVHVRHHFVVTHAGRNPTGAPHDAGHSETALERRALLTAERHRASVRHHVE